MRKAAGMRTAAEIRAAAPLYPGPVGREMTPLEAAVLGKMQENPSFVHESLPFSNQIPTLHRLQVVAEGTGGAVVEATVFSFSGRYEGLQLEGAPVAERLGVKYASLHSDSAGRAEGRRYHTDTEPTSTESINVESGWRRLMPWRVRATGRIALLFWNGGPYLPPVEEPEQ